MSKRNVIKDIDKGWGRIRREARKAKRGGVKVGIMGSGAKEDYPSGADIIDVALYNEFGTETIPARPFVRGAFDNSQSDLINMQKQLWASIVEGRMSAHKALGRLGRFHQGQIQEYMPFLSQPPNAPSTIAQKRASNPLIDNKRLRGAVTWDYE